MRFRIQNHSIAAELTWMNLLVSASALLLACAAFAAYDLIMLRESMVRVLSIQAQIIGANSVSAMLFNDPHSAESSLAALKAGPNIIKAEIYTPDGLPFAGYFRGHRRKTGPLPKIPAGQTEAHWFKNKELIVVRRINFQGKPAETVLMESDLRQINNRLKRYAAVVFFIVVACLAAVFLMSSFMRRSIAEPLLRLADTASIVSRDKDYSVRASQVDRYNELAILVKSFNEMLDQIQERDAALKSAHAELELRVQERTRQLAGANKELEAFSYSVSHDIRAPLRQIDGFSNILVNDYGRHLDAEALRYLNLIRNGARKMGQLVDDLLNMGRIGRQELTRRPTDLNPLLQSVLQDMQPELEGRQIEWRIGALPTLECDPGLVRVVFVNLLSNAVKYTRRKESALIEVGQAAHGGEVVLFVRDNGAGFDQKYAHKLFGVFQRLHRADDFEGTGVGLATVQRIIHKHGGRIWAEARVNEGAAFFFTLETVRHGAQSRALDEAA